MDAKSKRIQEDAESLAALLADTEAPEGVKRAGVRFVRGPGRDGCYWMLPPQRLNASELTERTTINLDGSRSRAFVVVQLDDDNGRRGIARAEMPPAAAAYLAAIA